MAAPLHARSLAGRLVASQSLQGRTHASSAAAYFAARSVCRGVLVAELPRPAFFSARFGGSSRSWAAASLDHLPGAGLGGGGHVADQRRGQGGSVRRRNFTARSMASSSASAVFGRPAAETIVIPPSGEHTATVVWLHGLGDTGAGWADLVEMLELKNVKWVLPSAPIRPVTINQGFPCPSWFDIKGLSAESPQDVAGLDAAAAHVVSLLQAEAKAPATGGSGPVKVLVGGFSQGGALSLYVTSRRVLGKYSNGSAVPAVSLHATIALSCWLPSATALADEFKKDPSLQAAEKPPVLMCHGQNDPLVLYNFGEMSAQALRSLGFKVDFKSYPRLAHEAGPEELADVKKWAKSVL